MDRKSRVGSSHLPPWHSQSPNDARSDDRKDLHAMQYRIPGPTLVLNSKRQLVLHASEFGTCVQGSKMAYRHADTTLRVTWTFRRLQGLTLPSVFPIVSWTFTFTM